MKRKNNIHNYNEKMNVYKNDSNFGITKNKSNILTSNSAITLIALIITIIVLLILAGVTLNMVIGENGIFIKAQTAKDKMNYSSAKEIVELEILNSHADCAAKNKEFTLVELTKDFKELDNITIVKCFNEPIAKTTGGLSINYKNLNGIVVCANEYPKYNFLIGENCKITGIYEGTVNDETTRDSFTSIDEYEKNESINQDDKFEIEEVSLTIGKSKTLVAKLGNTTLDNTEVEWESSDKSIISINKNGVITGKNLGTASITGTLKSNGEKKEIITIEVTELIQAIYTKEDMEEFRYNVNTGSTYAGLTVKLMKNIDIQGSSSNTWETIGSEANIFKGTFEGNSNTVKGLYVDSTNSDQGLFGYAENSTIQNLKVNGYVKGEYFVGGIVGRINNSTVQNCEFSGNVIGTSENDYTDVGGIVGRIGVYGGNVIECKNHGTIQGAIDVSGIVGWQMCGIIENCYNYGEISGLDGLGGITGSSGNNNDESTMNKEVKIINCNNYAKVYSEHQDGAFLGGICGWLMGNNSELNSCNNYGEINCKGYSKKNATYEYSGVGGIVGGIGANGINKKIINCINEGNLYAEGAGIGGIVGWHGIGTIESCKNTGNVIGKFGEVGGIVGYAGNTAQDYNIYIKKCINSGKIECESSRDDKLYGKIGGIAGIFIGEIEDCVNKGDIYAVTIAENGNADVGGIVGRVSSTYGTILYCYNTGNIISEYETVGGIVGSTMGTAANNKIQYCYNIGNVKTPSYGGGIVGWNKSNAATVSNCYYLQGSIELTDSDAVQNTLGESANAKTIKSIVTMETWKEKFVKDKSTNINNGFPILSWQ